MPHNCPKEKETSALPKVAVQQKLYERNLEYFEVRIKKTTQIGSTSFLKINPERQEEAVFLHIDLKDMRCQMSTS